MWAWILMPSYLNSMAHLPSILAITSGREGSLSASITFIGLPTETFISDTAAMPPRARVSPTRPMSQVTLNALSISGLALLSAKHSARASSTVMADAPVLILPVTILHRYFAPSGSELLSRRDRIFIFWLCESFPSERSISVSPSTTASRVRVSENRVRCFFLEIRSSATMPGSPSFCQILSASSSGYPAALATALSTSLSAMPSSMG